MRPLPTPEKCELVVDMTAGLLESVLALWASEAVAWRGENECPAY